MRADCAVLHVGAGFSWEFRVPRVTKEHSDDHCAGVVEPGRLLGAALSGEDLVESADDGLALYLSGLVFRYAGEGGAGLV